MLSPNYRGGGGSGGMMIPWRCLIVLSRCIRKYCSAGSTSGCCTAVPPEDDPSGVGIIEPPEYPAPDVEFIPRMRRDGMAR